MLKYTVFDSICILPYNVCLLLILQDDFNVDQFVVSCRRHTSLEVLHDDLTLYMKSLQSAMIELINKDYADFVNLSSNLVGQT